MFLTEKAIANHYTTTLQSLSEIAEAYYFQGRLDDAFRLWQTSEQLLVDREIQPAERVKFLLRYGQFLIHNYFLTNHEEDLMLSVIRRAQQEAGAIKDESAIATALYLVGQTLYYHNLLAGGTDYTEARDYFQQASALREKVGDNYGLAEALFYTGLTYDRHDQREQAEGYYQRALELAEHHGNKWAASEANRHLADAHMTRDMEQSLQYALRSLALREGMGFKRALPAAQLLVSDVYIELGDLAQALEYCQQAEQLSVEMGLRSYLIEVLLVRGEVAYRQKQFAEAREYFEQAAALARELNIAYAITVVNGKLEMLAREQAG